MTRILIFALAAVLGMSNPTQSLTAGARTTNLIAVDEGAAFDRAVVAQMMKDQQEAADLARHPEVRGGAPHPLERPIAVSR